MKETLMVRMTVWGYAPAGFRPEFRLCVSKWRALQPSLIDLLCLPTDTRRDNLAVALHLNEDALKKLRNLKDINFSYWNLNSSAVSSERKLQSTTKCCKCCGVPSWARQYLQWSLHLTTTKGFRAHEEKG